jgi:outer membrane protein assembly factor BamB
MILRLLFLLVLFLIILINSSSILASWTMDKSNSSRTGKSPYTADTAVTTKWSTTLTAVSSSPVVVDTNGQVYVSTNKGLQALDGSGNKLWFASTSQVPSSKVIDANNNIYFSSTDCTGFIYSYSAQGTKNWEYNLRQNRGVCGDYAVSILGLSPDGTTLYVGARYPANAIIALNLDGTQKWYRNLNYYPTNAAAIAEDGTIYVGTGGSGILFALNSDGTIKWQKSTASGSTVSLSTPAIDSSSNIYVQTSGATTENLVSFNSTGTKRWSYALPAGTSFNGSPSIDGSVVYISETTNIRAINATNGTLLWKWIPPSTTSKIATNTTLDKNGNIYFSQDNKIYSLSPDGSQRWSHTISSLLGSIVIAEDNLLYVTQTKSTTSIIHALSTLPLPSPSTSGTATSSAIPTPSPQPPQYKNPLIIIPGIGGSELRVKQDTVWSAPDGHGGIYSHYYPAGEKVWVNEAEAIKPGDDDYFDILRMKPDGLTSEAELETTGNLVGGSYQATIDYFVSQGYTMGQDLFVFPYDWRRDIITTKPLLDQKIEEIKAHTGKSQVDIIAHSMGGLVARYYISDSSKLPNVRKLITVGTPYLGSVEMYKQLLHGGCLTRKELQDLPLPCIGINPSEAKDVMQNYISGYEISPTREYYHFYTSSLPFYPYPILDGRDIDNNDITGQLTYDQTKSLFTNLQKNISLITYAENFHQISQQYPTCTICYMIVGSGQPTLGQIIEKYAINFLGIKISKTDYLMINGDQTVPLYSAALYDPLKNMNLKGSTKIYYSNQSHSDLMSDMSTLAQMKSLIDGNENLVNNISVQPFPLKGKLISVHSPVNVHIYDVSGNHTGITPDGGFEQNIPGSVYDSVGESKYIWLPDDGQYTIKIDAYDAGTYDLKIREYNNNENTSTVLYKDVAITSQSKGLLTLDTTAPTTSVLQSDKNGDGTYESQINKTSQISSGTTDTTAPNTQITLTGSSVSTNSYISAVQITLTSLDETGGSGILKTEYQLDSGLITSYSSPINVSSGGSHTIKYQSTDQAGNTESIQQYTFTITNLTDNLTTSSSTSNSNNSTSGNSSTQISISSLIQKSSAFKEIQSINSLLSSKKQKAKFYYNSGSGLNTNTDFIPVILFKRIQTYFRYILDVITNLFTK